MVSIFETANSRLLEGLENAAERILKAGHVSGNVERVMDAWDKYKAPPQPTEAVRFAQDVDDFVPGKTTEAILQLSATASLLLVARITRHEPTRLALNSLAIMVGIRAIKKVAQIVDARVYQQDARIIGEESY